MSESVQVCLVSEQVLPNLIPLLAAARERPVRACLVVSDDMRAVGQRLARLLEARSIPATVHDGMPSAGFAGLLDYARSRVAELRAEWGSVRLTFNATGGNKLMTLAFFEAFRDVPGTQVIYTDTAHGCIETLAADGSVQPMTGVVDMATYLAAYGYRIESAASAEADWQASVAARGPVTDWLGLNAGRLGGLFSQINAALQRAFDRDGTLVDSGPFTLKTEPQGPLRRALEQLAAAEVLTWDAGSTFVPLDTATARYLCGGWLEEYAWRVVSRLAPEEVATNVQVSREDGGAGNELDLLAVQNNRLLMVECKTARFGYDPVKDADRVYKLESLGRHLGGPFSRRVLLSAHSLPVDVRERATGQGVRVLAGAELARFGNLVQDWQTIRSGQ